MGYAPDLTSNVNSGRGNDYFFSTANSDKNSNCSNKRDSSTGITGTSTPIHLAPFTSDFRPLSEHHYYELPMVTYPKTRGSPVDSLERSPFLADQQSSNGSSGQPSPPATFVQKPPTGLPKSVDLNYMNWATVTETGTRITIPRSSVTLTVPQGAVAKGVNQKVYVALVSNGNSKMPVLDSSRAPVTGIVMWGTPKGGAGRKLLKPTVLSIPHTHNSLYTNSNNKNVAVLYCSDLDADAPEWSVMGENEFQVEADSSQYHMVTDRQGAFFLVSSVTDLNQIGGGSGARGSTTSGYSSLSSPILSEMSMVMSGSTKQALCRCLDVPTCQGNDWRQLAEALGYGQLSGNFAQKVSPSEALLGFWEANSGIRDKTTALRTLAQLLQNINRQDAIIILEREIKK